MRTIRKTSLILFAYVLIVGILTGCGSNPAPVNPTGSADPSETKPSSPSVQTAETEAAIAGIDDWQKEVISDKPGNTKICYYTVNKSNERTTMLDVNHMTEEHDIDNDGQNEIIVYIQKNNNRSIGIYDMVEGELQYLDVNETLGCDASDYTGNIGNIKREYSNAIQAIFKETDSISRIELYSVTDHTFTYECLLEEALLK